MISFPLATTTIKKLNYYYFNMNIIFGIIIGVNLAIWLVVTIQTINGNW